MPTNSATYKIASIIQFVSAALGGMLMLTTVLAEKTNQHELVLKSGPFVGILFFSIAVSSAVKSFSQK